MPRSPHYGTTYGYGSNDGYRGAGPPQPFAPMDPSQSRGWNGVYPQNGQVGTPYAVTAPAMPAMPTTAYQPARQGYGYRTAYQPVNPFVGYQGDEVAQDYYRNNPQAVIGQWLAANPAGEMPAAMRRALEQWLGDQQNAYAGAAGMRPDLNFWDWLGERNFQNDYEATNPHAGALRANYRTRYLRR